MSNLKDFILTRLEEYLGFYDEENGFIWNLFKHLEIKMDSRQVITFPNGKKYRLDLAEIEKQEKG